MPLGFQIGPVFVRYYGIILMLGAVAAAWMATHPGSTRDHHKILPDSPTGRTGNLEGGTGYRRGCDRRWVSDVLVLSQT
jgi:hypothetical protein